MIIPLDTEPIRSFMFRNFPLIKIRLLVDAPDWDKAQELADLENVTII